MIFIEKMSEKNKQLKCAKVENGSARNSGKGANLQREFLNSVEKLKIFCVLWHFWSQKSVDWISSLKGLFSLFRILGAAAVTLELSFSGKKKIRNFNEVLKNNLWSVSNIFISVCQKKWHESKIINKRWREACDCVCDAKTMTKWNAYSKYFNRIVFINYLDLFCFVRCFLSSCKTSFFSFLFSICCQTSKKKKKNYFREEFENNLDTKKCLLLCIIFLCLNWNLWIVSRALA